MATINLIPEYNAINWYNPFNDFMHFVDTDNYNDSSTEGKIIKALNSAAITRAIKVKPDTVYVIDGYWKMDRKPFNNTSISIGFGNVENFIFENVEINMYNNGERESWLSPFVFTTPSNATYLKVALNPGQDIDTIDEKVINGDYDFGKHKNILTEYHQLILIEGDTIPDSMYIL